MTEKEKMIAGDWYDANYDQELLDMRLKTEQYCYDFNNARPQSVQQLESLKSILGTEIPEGVTVLAPVYFDYLTLFLMEHPILQTGHIGVIMRVQKKARLTNDRSYLLYEITLDRYSD